MIAREDRAEDLRAHTPALTPAGMALIPALADLADENDAAFFEDLTTDERTTLEHMLKGIVARPGLKSIPIA